MTVVEVPGVVLSAKDLSFPRSPWGRVARANSQRLLPLAVAGVASAILFGTRLDPGLLDIIAVLGPLVIGWYAFIWMTNSHYVGEYKKAHAQTPTGGAACDFTFDDRGMKQSGLGFQTVFDWKTFVEVTEDNGGYRFWLTPFSAVRLPYRYLDENKRAALDALIKSARERDDIKGAPQ
jgi:hypothetical protein